MGMIDALRRACPKIAKTDGARIEGVVLPGLITVVPGLKPYLTLMPDTEQSWKSYRVTLHVRGSKYEIEAHPVRRGVIYSLFRDQSGSVHFELGKHASADSPLLPDGLPSHLR